MLSLEESIQWSQEAFEFMIEYLDLGNFIHGTVDPIEISAKKFENSAIIAQPGLGIDALVLMHAAQNKKIAGKDLIFAYLPPLSEGNIGTSDSSDIYARFLLTVKDNIIIPYILDEPVPLVGLFKRQNDSLFNNVSLLQGNLSNFLGNKINFKKLLDLHSVPTPNWALFDLNNIHHTVVSIENFSRDLKSEELVAKASSGGGGSQVKIFNGQNVPGLVDYLINTASFGVSSYIEERISVEQISHGGKMLDWWIRSFVTIEDDPKYFGSVIMAAPHDGLPGNYAGRDINIPISVGIDQGLFTEDQIKEISLQTAIMFRSDAIRQFDMRGYVGLDLIKDSEFKVLEANPHGQVSALSAILKHYEDPSLLSNIFSLYESAIAKDLPNNKVLSWHTLDSTKSDLADALLRHSKFEHAANYYDSIFQSGSHSALGVRAGHANLMIGQYRKAIDFFTLNTIHDPDQTALDLILVGASYEAVGLVKNAEFVWNVFKGQYKCSAGELDTMKVRALKKVPLHPVWDVKKMGLSIPN